MSTSLQLEVSNLTPIDGVGTSKAKSIISKFPTIEALSGADPSSVAIRGVSTEVLSNAVDWAQHTLERMSGGDDPVVTELPTIEEDDVLDGEVDTPPVDPPKVRGFSGRPKSVKLTDRDVSDPTVLVTQPKHDTSIIFRRDVG